MRASSGRFQYVRGGRIENNLVKGGNGDQGSIMFQERGKASPVLSGSYGHAEPVLASTAGGVADPITFEGHNKKALPIYGGPGNRLTNTPGNVNEF